jgi:glycogen phosphorylase
VDTTPTVAAPQTHIPTNLARLTELSQNLWWSWTVEARQLFEAIDPTLWFYTHHNPVKLLADVKPARLAKLAEDPSYLRQYSAVFKLFDEYRANGRSNQERHRLLFR